MALVCILILLQLALAQRAFVLSMMRGQHQESPALTALAQQQDGWLDGLSVSTELVADSRHIRVIEHRVQGARPTEFLIVQCGAWNFPIRGSLSN